MPLDVLCVGHAAFDLSFFVEAFPEENSKSETRELLEGGGGPAANAAYLLSSWGCRCGFAGVVGYDRYGQEIRAEFQRAGTDVRLFELRPGHATPVSAIIINKGNGSRTILNRKAPTAPLGLDRACLEELSPKVLLFDGHEPEASLLALESFPEAISILDAGSWRKGTMLLAPRVQYLAASERFALRASGLDTTESEAKQRACISFLYQLYGNRVIVTMGERGLIAEEGSGFFHLPAFVSKAVDTTAAGDIFHGALAWALLKETPFRDALRFASMAAALSVRKPGGRQSIPTLAEVEEALRNAG